VLATGKSPTELLEWQPWEIELAHAGLPRHWGRLSWPMAQLTADFREMFFPRMLEPEPPTEPAKPRIPWTVDELLPPFADPPTEAATVPEHLRRLLLNHRAHLPTWAVALVDWRRIEGSKA
jgi:hypothetical protein